MPKPWFTRSVIYELDVRTFFDGNGDGIGDFAGLTRQLHYVAGLGVTTLWLNPFFASPGRDGGYDISDYYKVDPSLGSLGDFVTFLEEAHALGLNVIIELVVNHSSRDHPWFQKALEGRDAPTRDFYIWVDEPPADSPERITFTPDEGDDPSPWTRDESSDQFYLHRFYPHEPDLNHAEPAVQDEVFKIMSAWLAVGVDGFRIDAAPYVAEKAASDDGASSPHDYLRRIRGHMSKRRPEAVLMAEADVSLTRLGDYFGRGDEMGLLLNFLSSETTFAALAGESAEPMIRMLRDIPDSPPNATYANFLRNHDELDLEKLPPDEQALVFDTFAPDPEMRIFGRGIRRRSATMLGPGTARLRLGQSVIFALPGVPVVRYGDELGMGDDLTLPDRTPVRTPMQWSDGPNGGFSDAESEDLYLPVVDGGDYAYERVNVAAQEGDAGSQLNWTIKLIGVRRRLGFTMSSSWRLADSGNEAVLAIRYQDRDDVVMTLHNFSSGVQRVESEPFADLVSPNRVFADREYDLTHALAKGVELGPFGYLWLTASKG